MTLTREQTSEFKEFVFRMARKSELLVQDYEFGEFCKELDSICNMALNSIPKAFDPEDETTWPEKGRAVLIEGDCTTLYERLVQLNGMEMIAERGVWWTWHELEGKQWIYCDQFFPTPIPEVGESK